MLAFQAYTFNKKHTMIPHKLYGEFNRKKKPQFRNPPMADLFNDIVVQQ